MGRFFLSLSRLQDIELGMKEMNVRRVLAMIAVVGLASMAFGAEDEAPKVQLETLAEKFSYALGLQVGAFLASQGDVDLTLFMRGVDDVLKKRKPLLTRQEAADVKEEFSRKRKEELAVNNKKEGKAFLAENKKKENVVTTASGLQYTVLSKGDGATPKATDRVRVHYEGTLINGTVFDSSYKRGEPVSFPVNGVIAGWTEALQLMKVGSKYRLFIPSGLAYKDRGAGNIIGPHATLIFDVELLGIE